MKSSFVCRGLIAVSLGALVVACVRSEASGSRAGAIQAEPRTPIAPSPPAPPTSPIEPPAPPPAPPTSSFHLVARAPGNPASPLRVMPIEGGALVAYSTYLARIEGDEVVRDPAFSATTDDYLESMIAVGGRWPDSLWSYSVSYAEREGFEVSSHRWDASKNAWRSVPVKKIASIDAQTWRGATVIGIVRGRETAAAHLAVVAGAPAKLPRVDPKLSVSDFALQDDGDGVVLGTRIGRDGTDENSASYAQRFAASGSRSAVEKISDDAHAKVAFLAPDDIWAFDGDPGAARWDGTTWAAADVPAGMKITSVARSRQGTTWLVGSGGVLRAPPGSLEWQKVLLPTVDGHDLAATDVFAPDDDDVWISAGIADADDDTALLHTRASRAVTQFPTRDEEWAELLDVLPVTPATARCDVGKLGAAYVVLFGALAADADAAEAGASLRQTLAADRTLGDVDLFETKFHGERQIAALVESYAQGEKVVAKAKATGRYTPNFVCNGVVTVNDFGAIHG